MAAEKWLEIDLTQVGTELAVAARGSQEMESSEHPPFPLEIASRFEASVRQAARSQSPLSLPDEQLQEAIFRPGVREVLHKLQGTAQGRPLLLKLNPRSPALRAIPWEALRPPGSDSGFLGTSPELLVARGVASTTAWQKREVQGAVRLLVISPEDPEAPGRLKSLLIESLASGELEWLEPLVGPRASKAGVEHRLRQEPVPHILHFIGHGGLEDGSPSLQMAPGSAQDPGYPVSLLAEELRNLFRNELRLIVLESCSGAQPGELLSAAEELARGAAGAVIAHLWEVKADVARRCSAAFYRSLTGRSEQAGDVARSLHSARRTILNEFQESAEAFSPVLYLRGRQPVLFDFSRRRAVPPRESSEAIAAVTQEPAVILLSESLQKPRSLVIGDRAIAIESVGQLNLKVEGLTAEQLLEVLRLAAAVGQNKGATEGGDPFGAEIEANGRLIDRFLFSEALEGFRSLQLKCGSKPGLSRSRFRIANNIGVCLMGLGRFSEAKAEFRKALSIETESELTRVNLAAAHLHANEPALALSVLDKPIADPSVRGKAGALRVAALCRLGRHDDMEQFIRDEAWTAYDAHVQLAVAQARSARGDDGVEEALRVAVENGETALDAHLLKGQRALGIEERRADANGIVLISKGVSRERMEEALLEFQQALQLCPVGLRDFRAELLAKTGLALALLGRSEQAVKAFEESQSIGSRPSLPAVVNYAAVLMERKEFATAAHLIRDSGFVDQHPRMRLQLGMALRALDADKDVIDLLDNAWRTFPLEEERILGAALLLESCRRLQRAELGKEVVDTLEREHAESWEAWFHLGRHFADAGDRTRSLTAFQKALLLVDEEDSRQVREELVRRQAAWGDYAGCITTLDPLDVMTLGEVAAQSFIVSLYNAGALRRARAVAEKLLTREQVPIQVIEVAAAVASQAGDLRKATKLQLRLLQERGPLLRDINFLADLLLRNGERAQAVEALAVDAGGMDGGQNAYDLMVFAHLLSAVRDKRALTYGYRSWERGRDQSQIQLGYVTLFLRRERTGGSNLEADVVAPGTTVTLSVVGKSDSRVVSIVREGELIQDPATWVKASDPLAARLLGKRVGDEIVGSSTPLGQTIYRIVKIQSVFVRAFQETMAGFNDRFPDAEGLWKFQLQDDDPSEIEKVLLNVQGNFGRTKELVALHAQGLLPLSALAGALQRSIPVTWAGLTQDGSGSVRFSFGATKELKIAERIVGGHNEPVYLDYSALMTLVLLDDGLRSKIAELIKPVRVMQSLLDDLHEHSVQAMPMGTGEGMAVSVGEDGRLRGAPLGDEHGFLMRVQEIAREIALPCAAYSQFDAPPAAREVASKLLGLPTTDLLWEVAAAGGIMLCDDHALGVLAREQHQTPTASIQAIALAAYRKGQLTRSEYSGVVERLATARYHFVTVDEEIIEVILERHKWQPTQEVAAVFSCFEGPECNTESAAYVGARVLKAIVLEPASALSRNALIDALLARLTTGHNVRRIVELMLRHLRDLLRLAPFQFKQLYVDLNAWIAARSS